jgi:hypothetical protein
LALTVAAVLPIPPGAKGPVNAVALIVGAAGGIVFSASRERREAAGRGTRALHDFAEHETYRTFFTDQARWRAHRDPTAHKECVERGASGDGRRLSAEVRR